MSAHRSATYSQPPLGPKYDSDHPFISYYDLLEGRKLGITDYHHLCILIQVLVRLLPGSYRREYRPLRNHPLTLPSLNTPQPTQTSYGNPLPSQYLSQTACGPLRTRTNPSYQSTNRFPPVTNLFRSPIPPADSLRTPYTTQYGRYKQANQ